MTAQRQPTQIRSTGRCPSRFDEQDAFVIFDDVEIPKSRVFIDSNMDVYNSVMGADAW